MCDVNSMDTVVIFDEVINIKFICCYFLVKLKHLLGKSTSMSGVLVFLNCVPILVCLDCFTHSVTMVAFTSVRCKTAEIHRIEHSRVKTKMNLDKN